MTNPTICPNTLLYSISNTMKQTHSTRSEAHYLIYFLPGNPGLIEFYRSFLELVHQKLSKHIDLLDGEARIDILGITLVGFECQPIEVQDKHRSLRSVPLDIDGQLDFIENHLADHASHQTQVILMGHSLGAYMIMEILRRYHSKRGHNQPRIIGAIGLFPAVVHLAQSEGGQRIARLFQIPCLPYLILLVVRILSLLPRIMIFHAVRMILQYPEHSAETTARWLQSRQGFWQSMHLLREEFERITFDRWEDKVWNSRIHLLFGETDVYVPNVHRDSLILARAGRAPNSESGQTRPEQSSLAPCLELAASGIPHDFSIMHSEPIAEKATQWVVRIVQGSQLQ